jgi:hypothetical protein
VVVDAVGPWCGRGVSPVVMRSERPAPLREVARAAGGAGGGFSSIRPHTHPRERTHQRTISPQRRNA